MAEKAKRSKISGAGRGLFVDPGQPGINILRIAADVADTETVTIGNDVFEFDRAGNGVTSGRIAVTGHAGDTPAAASNALITAINNYSTQGIKAVDISDNEILIYGTETANQALACTETMAGSNNAWAVSAMYGYRAGTARNVAIAKRAPNATEVALGNMHFVFGFDVQHCVVQVVDTNEKVKAWDGVFVVASNRVKLDNSGDTDFAATDTVTVIAFGA